jgi:glycosyltransferase involved in cell wall biosynthesis
MNSFLIGIHASEGVARVSQTLAALRANTSEPHEVLLLIDGTKGAEITSALSLECAQVITGQTLGAPACFNRLVTHNKAEVCIFLESGLLVGSGWLTRLIAALKADPRNGLAGPSTNNAWNEQCAFPQAKGDLGSIARTAQEAARRFGPKWSSLEPLYSLSDFCYVVRREVIETIGLGDEGYGSGPCWEMDYNIRAARAGWRGIWVGGAYVYRPPSTERRQREQARLFEASKHRYQDKFCGARLRGQKHDYRQHCRGDACPNFAPTLLLQQNAIVRSSKLGLVSNSTDRVSPPVQAIAIDPLVSCVMPTCDRLQMLPHAIQNFFRQDYKNRELIIVDDGVQSVESLLPADPRIRLVRLQKKHCVGAKRNIACGAARGEIIIHCDDDDWYPKDRVRRQIESLADKRFTISGTSTLYYFEATTNRSWKYCYSGRNGWVAGNTLAYRKSWWCSHPFPEVQVGEDSRFVWAAPPQLINDLRQPDLCLARIHSANTSAKSTGSSFWQPCAVSMLQEILGADWTDFSSLGTNLARPFPPLVSCIMPTFNRRKLIPLALASFEAQDYPNKELIVVDDGTDPISDLISGLFPHHYISLRERCSIGAKRNLACQSARGAIIAHWDDDDWYAPARLSLQVAPLLAGEADLTGLENSFQLELATGEFWRPNPQLHRRMFLGDVHGGTLAYWRNLFEEGVRYPEINLAEDALFIRTAQKRGKRLVRVSNPGIFVYNRHGYNSWRFQSGVFLDPHAWTRVNRPQNFSEELIAAFRIACDPSLTEQTQLSAKDIFNDGERAQVENRLLRE